MLLKTILSAIVFIILFETISVLFKGIKRELDKEMELGSSISRFKITLISLLIMAGFYVEFFLILVIWIPEIRLNLYLKVFTVFLAVSYILGVLSLSFSKRKTVEFHGLPGRMASQISPTIDV